MTQKLRVVFLLVMILIGKIGDMWRYVDLETKKIMVSHDVVFDEVSSCQIKGKIDLAPFYEDVASSERGSNIYSCQENIQQDEISDGVTQDHQDKESYLII